ncbi:TIR domain-containing protein [Parapedobacter pyrenivorans]|uniref:TIR domain-containing protein n=1 Tax=Parapedobacter pyrenivorans TaxID=1305674 RepID=UPI0016669E5A|nr:nucleotide-binding protein [Parapedobacter pyrenivorans]
MNNTAAIVFAKIAALKKSFDSIEFSQTRRVIGSQVKHLFPLYSQLINEIKEIRPELYSDLPELKIPTSIGNGSAGPIYEQHDITGLAKNLDYILEVFANSRIGENHAEIERKNFIFISHGLSKEWFKVQSHLEKDLGYQTIELAQQPNHGRTILHKLAEEAQRCQIAIIIMTGDDKFENSEIRARENVLHEIGFFQGKLGLEKVVLLHEEGVSIPSNIHGLVYIAFPKDTVEATFGALNRELKVLMI